jgi:eukaryotic-like serine/threonine-protein kinase
VTARLDGVRVDSSLLPPRYVEPVLVARGGMSEVYKATDAELRRIVAVKLLDDRHVADGELPRRFSREARAAARLSGEPHTVTIYDVGVWQGRPFIVMEYLAGGSLEDVLRRDGAQSPALALRWLGEAAGALDHAHAEGVVHRDVKPANLLLDEPGSVYVADFGIATALGLTSLTRTGTVLGTAGYLAPEQAEGTPVGAAADRYSLGVVAFELLTGERPFRRDSVTAEVSAHVNAPIPSASSRRNDLPTLLDPVFERALAKEPEERFTTCGELVGALQDAYRASEGTTRIAAPAAARSAPSRARRWALLGVLALLVSAGALLAADLTRRHDGAAAQTRPRTATVTVTAPTQPSPASAASAPIANDSASLARRAQALVSAGALQTALPLLEQAVGMLSGTGTAGEANTDWNLAYTYAELGRCSDALPLLDRAQAINGEQARIDELRTLCTGPPGHQPGHHGKGHD